MREIFENIRDVYGRLEDDKSREIFAARLFYNLSGDENFHGNDESYLNPIYRVWWDEGTGVFQKIQEYSRKEKIIFGAGAWGARINKLFPDLGVRYFADSCMKGNIDGIPILPFDEMVQRHKEAIIIVSSTKYYEEMNRQLLAAGVAEENIWLLGKEIKEWQQDISRRTYFDLPALPHVSKEVFVDAGGFDGTTSLSFCDWCQGDYEKIYVFEPNKKMFDDCHNTLRTTRDCEIFHKGLWNRTGTIRVYEDQYHQMKLIDLDQGDLIGESDIAVASLDQMLGNQRVTFIKMDIEGAEQEALQGAETIIRTQKPKLAISVYHKKADLWNLPKQILSYRDDYTLYLRHYSATRYETVLYAI